jgi:ketosteroid isomerase-like protein
MPIDLDKLSPEERKLAEKLTRSSWGQTGDAYKARDFDAMADHCEPDVISAPANHYALKSREAIRDWYIKRMSGDYEMNVETDLDAVDIVGDLAIAAGTFRVCRTPQQGVAGIDHGGRFLAIYKKGEDGEWRVWRDMDTPSPDANIFYDKVERGW